MIYTRIYDAFWSDKDIQALDDSSKLLYLYTITCKHRNILGFYELPLGYICNDLKWRQETVSKRLSNLSERVFIRYDGDSNYILIPKFLVWNPLENPNQETSAVKKVLELPLIPLLVEFRKAIETLSKPFPNLFETVSKQETEYRRRNSTQKEETEGEGNVPPIPPKRPYSEFQNVMLFDEEYKKLTERYGEVVRDDYIQRLGAYLATKKKHYESHYATILNWYRRDHPNKEPESHLPDMQDIDYENQG